MTQKEEIKEYLDTGKPLTRLIAATELFIFELSSRIGELESEGYLVSKKRVSKTNSKGKIKRFVEYKKVVV